MKNKRYSADGQNIIQTYTTTRVVVTMQYLTAVSHPEEDLQPIIREEVEIALAAPKRGKYIKRQWSVINTITSHIPPQYQKGKKDKHKILPTPTKDTYS